MTEQTSLDVGAPVVTFHERPYRHYKVNGLKVPSVTQVIGLLDKPALKFWAQREAVKGTAALAQQYGADDAVFRDPAMLARAIDGKGWRDRFAAGDLETIAALFVELYEAQDCTLPWERPEDILRLLKASDESITAVMKRAADRGLVLHGGLEDYAAGKPLKPDAHPEYAGYWRALTRALVDLRPTFHGSEVVVGSAIHGYGGRLDNVLTLRNDGTLRDSVGVPVPPGRGLVDLKTNRKGEVYAKEHFTQVEAYELAAVECGKTPTDWRAVLAIGENGEYQFRLSTGRPETFLALLAAYRELKEDERREKKAGRS